MRLKTKTIDFNFDYTGSNFLEKDAIKNGFNRLTGKELWAKLINKTWYGDYPWGYKFITQIYDTGRVEGINHVGSQDLGDWMIDMEEHTLSLTWNNGWIDTTTCAYEVNGNIEFYDVDTGKWRTTFKGWGNWEEE